MHQTRICNFCGKMLAIYGGNVGEHYEWGIVSRLNNKGKNLHNDDVIDYDGNKATGSVDHYCRYCDYFLESSPKWMYVVSVTRVIEFFMRR